MIVAGYYDGKDYGPPPEWLRKQEYARYGNNKEVECDEEDEDGGSLYKQGVDK